MTQSFTYTDTTTFTVTHAQHIAAKVATDLKRMQRFYGVPSDSSITEFEQELVVMLKKKLVETVTYGFKRGDAWIEPTLRYTAQELSGVGGVDDDPGKIRPGADVAGASFYTYMTYTSAYFALSTSEREALGLPFIRGGAEQPSVSGYFSDDRVYSAGGRALNRSTVRTF
ncbi:hypothetical protein FJ420_31945 [Mesorhizobium sp. B3-1-3]|uniref:HORMA-1 domain-containing protein n=1 Tax=unclassified Mesorhizobium TaxID=325217 RepID=UPI00112B8387|nr:MULTISPECIES: hypothetical protein [unclassified Mesorhizobium]TPI53306.1 hypothetical protein FJ424_32240 [Mesorhizobium sp. B3-1-8]TPI60089.1 hypothetical protein FJ420_31945 [Mesorhizobium sp. B3-1-3]